MNTPVNIAFSCSHVNFSVAKLLNKWSCGNLNTIDSVQDFCAFPHFHNAGFGVFSLEDEESIISFVEKTAKKNNTHVLRILIAHLTLFSQFDRVSIERIVDFCYMTSPVKGHEIAEEEWENFMALKNDVLQFRGN